MQQNEVSPTPDKQPFLESKLGLRDTRGVHNLHGIPGILAAVVSFIVVGSTAYEQYGSEYLIVFPAASGGIYGMNRSPSYQVLYQFVALIVTLGIAIVGGAITGAFLRMIAGAFVWPLDELYYDDSYSWLLPIHREADTMDEAYSALRLEEEPATVVDETAVPLIRSDLDNRSAGSMVPNIADHGAAPHVDSSAYSGADMMAVSVAVLPGESVTRLPSRVGRV